MAPHQKERRLKLGHRLIMAGLSFLALAILGVVFLISELMVGGAGALAATLGIGVVWATSVPYTRLVCWHDEECPSRRWAHKTRRT